MFSAFTGRFYPTDTEGVFKCVVHPGRKDGKKGKGVAFELLVGTGDKPGQDYAALTVLHRVQHDKPLERLLAPEYRQTWLHLGERHDQRLKNIERSAAKRERREHFDRLKELRESNRQSGVINISSNVRQLIEDAVLSHKMQYSRPSPSLHGGGLLPAKTDAQNEVYSDLVRKGFSKLDAKQASLSFDDVRDALDYLCLNLDESELPSSFAPSSDVEVVQFISKQNAKCSSNLIDSVSREKLTRLTCLSKLSVNRALKESKGDFTAAFVSLYNLLTYNVLQSYFQTSLNENVAVRVADERETEEETLEAIYGKDVSTGTGQLPEFESLWAAIVTFHDYIPGIGRKGRLQVAFLDSIGNYPFTPPAVLVSSSFDPGMPCNEIISPAEKRLLMRAAAGKIALDHLSGNSQDKLDPVPVIHSIVSFLCEATEAELLEAANQQSHVPKASLQSTPPTDSSGAPVKSTRNGSSTEQRILRNTDKPLPVSKLDDSPELVRMQEYRSNLPAYSSKHEIIAAVNRNQVIVISGATGSGKTTQVPQFLLEEGARSGVPMSLVCTQPRRIAAISVAERVAVERCQKVGNSVGYQVKLDSKKSPNTRLLFCTTGVLLRRLQSDPNLDALTHILVDEVHERSVETDFLLLLLREILPVRPTLKIVLMSATLEAEKFSSYFASVKGKRINVPVISIPGRTFPVEHLYLPDVVAYCGYRMKPGDPFSKKPSFDKRHTKYGPEPPPDAVFPVNRNNASLAVAEEDGSADDCYDEESDSEKPCEPGSILAPLAPCNSQDSGVKQTVSLIDQRKVNVDLISLLVTRVDTEGRKRNEMGAILIFLPGAAEIAAVLRKLTSAPGAEKFFALPLHSNLPPDDQKHVFRRAPEGKRKVICATNIAETSITVEDVTIVIDTLRAKQMSYDTLNGCSVLEENFISKAEAQQRAGRAGRVSSGTCYRLVSEGVFVDRLAAQPIPEIQRVGLEALILSALSIIPDVKVKGIPGGLFEKAVDPPSGSSVERAISILVDLGALRTEDNKPYSARKRVALTALGRHLSRLPTDARIGKLLIYGATLGCLDAALTICASISEGSPFVSPFHMRDSAREAKMVFAWGKSDLLTFVKAFNSWRKLREDGAGFGAETTFCSKNFLSCKALNAIAESRKQLSDYLVDAGFCIATGRNWERAQVLNEHGTNVRVLRAVICAALYPNIVRIDLPRTKYEEVAGGTIAKKHEARNLQLRCKAGRVFLHPESVNFFEGDYSTRWLANFTKVKTTKVFLRDSTMVSPYAILMFGGEIKVQHEHEEMTVDDWVVFRVQARVAIVARELRRELDSLLLRKFERPGMNLNMEGRVVTEAVILLITQEAQ